MRAKSTLAPSWDGWQKKRKIGKRKVGRSIAPVTVGHMINAWHFAKDLELPFNRFVTIRPRIIDSLSPAERIVLWDDYKNKIAQFARDNHFEHINVWSRESTRDTGEAEHLHLLTHIPPSLQEAFAYNVAKWCSSTDEIDVRPADYRLARQPSGRLHSAITYLTKNSPSAAKFRNFTYRLGGPILGKRAGWSRNLSPAAIARAEARHLIKSEFGHDRAIRSDLR